MRSDGQDLRLEVGADGAGERLDKYLGERVEELSRSAAARLIAEGHVTIDGTDARKVSRKLEQGEIVRVRIPPAAPPSLQPQDIAIEIVWEDDDVAVVNKPPGMVVHPSAGHDDETLVNALLFHLESLSGVGGEERPGIVHRLDKGTSGLMVVAKNDLAHRRLQESWHSPAVRKIYHAIVYGTPAEDEIRIDAPIGRHVSKRKRMAVSAEGRNATTIVRLLERFEGVCWVECELLTGRTHQIRVHLEHIGHPIVGDPVYGGPMWKGFTDKALASRLRTFERPALHSARLRFAHPSSGEALEFECGEPSDMASLLEWLANR